MFSIFKLAALALALVSTFCVVDEIVNGPKLLLTSVSLGKSFKFMGEFWPSAIAAWPTCNDGSRTGAIVFGHQ